MRLPYLFRWSCLLLAVAPFPAKGATNVSLVLQTTYAAVLSEPGEQDYFTFEGAPGQRLYFDALDVGKPGVRLTLLAPDGTALSPNGNAADQNHGPLVLTRAGTYQWVLRGTGDATNDYHFRVLDLAAATPVSPGTVLEGQLHPRAATRLYRFAGTRGQRIQLLSLSTTAVWWEATWRLVSPANELLASGSLQSALGTVTLPLDGDYCVLVEGNAEGVTPLSFQLQIDDVSDLPVPVSGLDQEFQGNLAAGQTNQVTFTAPAGLPLFFDSRDRAAGLQVNVISPTGTLLASFSTSADAGPWVLPRAGTYSVQVWGVTPSITGSYRFRFVNLADPSAVPALALNSLVQGALALPYQTDVFRLSATNGQPFFYDAIDADYDAVSFLLLMPISPSAPTMFNANADQDQGPFTLGLGGTYYVVAESRMPGATDYQFRMHSLDDQPMLALDTDLTHTFTSGYVSAFLQLDGQAGARLYFDSRASVAGGTYWYLLGPGHQILVNAGLNSDFEVTLPASGRYLLRLENGAAGLLTHQFRVGTPPTPVVPLALNAITSGTLAEAGEEHHYSFNASEGTRLYYDALDGDSDPIVVSLLGPTGQAVHLNSNNSDNDRGPFTLTAGGAYRLVVRGRNDTTGDYSFRLLNLADQETLALDTLTSGTLEPGRSAKIYRFATAAEQRLFLDSRASTSPGSYWYVYNETTGTPLANAQLTADMETTLPATATYALILSGSDANPVPYQFIAVTFETPEQSISLGETRSGALTEPGQQDTYTFQGHAGQRVYYDALDGDYDSIQVRLQDPSGVDTGALAANADTDRGPFTLTQNGTYRIVIDGTGSTVGDYRFRLLDVASADPLPLDTPVAGTIDPGRAALVYRLTGEPGQRLFFDSAAANSSGSTWSLYGPANQIVPGASVGWSADFDVGLPHAGDYVLVLDANQADPVPYQFRVVTYGTPAAALPLGTLVHGTLAEPGQKDSYTLVGTAGQRLFYDALDEDGDSLRVQLYGPAGQLVHLMGSNAETDRGPFTLTQSGSYRLVIEGNGAAVGNYRFRILDLATVPAYTVGSPRSGTLDPRLGADWVQFQGTAGQRVFGDALSVGGGTASWLIFGPADAPLAFQSAAADISAFTLPATAPYYLLTTASSSGTTPIDFAHTLTDVSDPAIQPSGIGPVHSGTLLPGETNTFTFTAPAGTRLYFDSREPGSGALAAALRDPVGTVVFATGANADSGPQLLPRSGTYTLELRGQFPTATAPFRFRLLNADQDAVLLATNTALSGTLEPHETTLFRFEGTAGQQYLYDAWEADYDNVMVALSDPVGTAAHLNQNADADRGPFTLSAPGPYLLAIANGSAVSTDFRFMFHHAGDQAVLAPDQETTGTLDPGYSTRLFRIQLAEGQSIFFDSLGATGGGYLSLFDPGNNTVGGASLPSHFEFSATAAGTYLLAVQGNAANPVPYRFVAVACPVTTQALTLGSTIQGTLTKPGERHVYTFTGTPGQRLYYDALQGDFQPIQVTLVSPTGTASMNQNSDSDTGPFTLGESGVYRITLKANGDATGNYQFRVLDAAAQPVLVVDTDLSGTLDPGYAAHLFQVNEPAGQTFFLDSLTSAGGAYWSLFNRNNTALAGAGLAGSFDVRLGPGPGHLLLLSGSSANPVPYLFRVVTYSISTQSLAFGASIAGTLAEPGERQIFMFTGTSGQRLYYDALQADYEPIYASLISPSGLTVFMRNTDSDHGPFRLVESGTHQLVISANSDRTGSFRFRMHDLAAQPVLPLDAEVGGVLDPAYSALPFQVEAAPGQSLFFDALSANTSGAWSLYDLDDAVVGNASIIQDMDLTPRPGGNHILLLDATSPNPLPYRFRVVTRNDSPNVVANRGPTLSPIGSLSIGQNELLAFTASAQDPDSEDSLRFSLDPGAPSNATIDPKTGAFSWIPPVTGYSGYTNLTVRVTDNGSPSLSAAQSLTIKVIAGPVLITVHRRETEADVLWRSAPGERYRIEYTDSLSSIEWIDFGVELTASEFVTQFTDTTVGTRPQRFYRIRYFPVP